MLIRLSKARQGTYGLMALSNQSMIAFATQKAQHGNLNIAEIYYGRLLIGAGIRYGVLSFQETIEQTTSFLCCHECAINNDHILPLFRNLSRNKLWKS